MTPSGMIRAGAVGGLLAALCCATPVLVLTLSALGLAGAAVWLDWFLIPALLGSVALVGYGIYRKRRAEACPTVPSPTRTTVPHE